MATEEKPGTQERSVLQEKSGILGRKMTRRQFGKDLAKLGLVGAALSTGVVSARDLMPEAEPKPKEYPRPTELPADVLTEEELKKAGIKIYQTDSIQLYLRRNALEEIPLFKDAAGGKEGVVISLVDHHSLSWNAVEKLPQDARLIFQTVFPHPSEYSEHDWQELREYLRVNREDDLDRIPSWQERLDELDSGELEKQTREKLDQLRKSLEEGKPSFWQKVEPSYSEEIEEAEKKLAKILSGEERERIQGILEFSQQSVAKANIILGDRKQAIAYRAQEEGPLGVHTRAKSLQDQNPKSIDSPSHRRRLIFVQNHPQWLAKRYLYISVGGESRPHPLQSYPLPEFSGGYYELPDTHPGFITHHEVAHYKEDEPWVEGEDETDRIAYERLMKAWQKFQETGDTTGYPFVFVTPEGITITKKPPDKRTPQTGEI